MANADVIMPKMGDGMTEGKLLAWKISDGAAVKEGDIIAEIETDKSAVEVPAEQSGILRTLLAEGETVPVGAKIATIGDGSSAPPKAQAAEQKAVQAPAAPAPKAAGAEPARVMGAKSAGDANGRIKASPLARKVAGELGVILSSLRGTGPNGRIIEADVRGAQQSTPAQRAAQTLQSTFGQATRVEFGGMRKAIARRMTQSKTQIPHFYLTYEVEMGPSMELRKHLNAMDESLPKISLNDFIVKAAALALIKVPAVNRLFDGDGYLQPAGAHVGIAVALDDGLIVPVVKDADRKSLRSVAKEGRELIEKARARKLQPPDYTGGTFTVSNLGGYDADSFIAIIDPAQGAILAVGAIKKMPVVLDEGSIGIGQRMNLTLSGDHRVMDGAAGAKFMQEIKRLLENPLLLLDLS